VREVSVLRSLALAVRASALGDFEVRHCALLLNAFAKLSLADTPMVTHIAHALLQMPPHAHTLQSAAMSLHALATLGPQALEAPLRTLVTAHLFAAARHVPVEQLHPLGVALTLNAVVKFVDSGGVALDAELLQHLVQGVRQWPRVPPAAGRSGMGEIGEGGGGGGGQLQWQDMANILNAVPKLGL